MNTFFKLKINVVQMMMNLEEALFKSTAKMGASQYIMPSNTSEVKTFFRLQISED
jgi:hypothetical protein